MTVCNDSIILIEMSTDVQCNIFRAKCGANEFAVLPFFRRMSGSMGYWGLEGMYVLGKARQRALDDAGLHLSYYGNLG